MPRAEVAFSIPEPELFPEGIAYDSVGGAYYVGSMNLRKIVRIAPDGDVTDFVAPAADGLWGVLGIAVDAERRILWAASSHAVSATSADVTNRAEAGSAGVFKYDLESGALVRKYVLDGSDGDHLLNDLAVGPDGSVYVTDSGEQAIYRIDAEADSLEVLYAPSDLPWPNGITWAEPEGVLFVALDGRVGRLTPGDTAISYVALPVGMNAYADGLYYHDRSLIAVWPFDEGLGVTRYRLDPALERVVDVERILPGHPTFAQPTTGAIAGSAIYVVANSQLALFSRIQAGEADADTEQPFDPIVLKVPLDAGAGRSRRQ